VNYKQQLGSTVQTLVLRFATWEQHFNCTMLQLEN